MSLDFCGFAGGLRGRFWVGRMNVPRARFCPPKPSIEGGKSRHESPHSEQAGCPGAFASAAPDMAARGLAVIPLGGDDGKRPLVKHWSRLKRRPGAAFLDKIASRHPDRQHWHQLRT